MAFERTSTQWVARPPPELPTGVRPISLAGTSLLGIGPDNRLYWDGQLLKIERTISLNWWQNLLAAATALGAFANGVVAVLHYIKG